MSVEILINNCKKGNRQAQEQLYKQYATTLFGICLKYSRNKTEAQDNLHDSFMTIYEKLGQYKGKGSFEGWLKRITVNTVLQKYRKKEPLTLVSENIDIDTNDEDYAESSESLDTLLRYVQELPNKYRLCFNLYVLDGYSHKEISTLLDISVGTSKSNLARARNILKMRIEKSRKPVIGILIFLKEFCQFKPKLIKSLRNE